MGMDSVKLQSVLCAPFGYLYFSFFIHLFIHFTLNWFYSWKFQKQIFVFQFSNLVAPNLALLVANSLMSMLYPRWSQFHQPLLPTVSNKLDHFSLKNTLFLKWSIFLFHEIKKWFVQLKPGGLGRRNQTQRYPQGPSAGSAWDQLEWISLDGFIENLQLVTSYLQKSLSQIWKLNSVFPTIEMTSSLQVCYNWCILCNNLVIPRHLETGLVWCDILSLFYIDKLECRL